MEVLFHTQPPQLSVEHQLLYFFPIPDINYHPFNPFRFLFELLHGPQSEVLRCIYTTPTSSAMSTVKLQTQINT